MANALTQAKTAAGPEIINATMVIPIFLSLSFAGLYLSISFGCEISLIVRFLKNYTTLFFILGITQSLSRVFPK